MRFTIKLSHVQHIYQTLAHILGTDILWGDSLNTIIWNTRHQKNEYKLQHNYIYKSYKFKNCNCTRETIVYIVSKLKHLIGKQDQYQEVMITANLGEEKREIASES